MHSVLTGTDEELKDLRPPADLSTPFWEQPAFFVLATLVVVAALGVPGYYLYRRSSRQVRVAEPVVDTRSPWEAAIQELDRIGRLDLPGKGDSKEHYTLVAGTLRAYLGADLPERYGADAGDRYVNGRNGGRNLAVAAGSRQRAGWSSNYFRRPIW